MGLVIDIFRINGNVALLVVRGQIIYFKSCFESAYIVGVGHHAYENGSILGQCFRIEP